MQWWGGWTPEDGSGMGIPRGSGGGRRLKTSIHGEEMKLNSKVDNVRFKGRKDMGEGWEHEQTEWP